MNLDPFLLLFLEAFLFLIFYVKKTKILKERILTLEKDNHALEIKYNFLKEEQIKSSKEFSFQSNLIKEQFTQISSLILKEQSKEFQKEQSEKLSSLLVPLKDQIQDFKAKLEHTHEKNIASYSGLETHIKHLAEVSFKVGSDAKNLAAALRGDNKTQGLWGEFMLENILQAAGLRQGHEYIREGRGLMLEGDEGQKQKPDVILLLPDDKHIIVDAKVSLVSYERALQKNLQEEVKKELIKEHLASLYRHVDLLAKKHYQKNTKLDAPDLVMMFIPIEGALSFAVEMDPSFLSASWEKKVIVASPTTLLASALTIGSVWKYASQNQNAQEIAEQGGRIYDKIVLFIDDLEKCGKLMDQAKDAFQSSFTRLCKGKGNILKSTEKLKDLGVNPKKNLNTKYENFLNEEEDAF